MLERKSVVQTKYRHTERCCVRTDVERRLNRGNRVKKVIELLCSPALGSNEML